MLILINIIVRYSIIFEILFFIRKHKNKKLNILIKSNLLLINYFNSINKNNVLFSNKTLFLYYNYSINSIISLIIKLKFISNIILISDNIIILINLKTKFLFNLNKSILICNKYFLNLLGNRKNIIINNIFILYKKNSNWFIENLYL